VDSFGGSTWRADSGGRQHRPDVRSGKCTFRTSPLKERNAANSAASASLETSANVQTVASAAEDLSASVSAIRSQVLRASDVTSEAATRTAETSTRSLLASEVEKISQIVSVIHQMRSRPICSPSTPPLRQPARRSGTRFLCRCVGSEDLGQPDRSRDGGSLPGHRGHPVSHRPCGLRHPATSEDNGRGAKLMHKRFACSVEQQGMATSRYLAMRPQQRRARMRPALTCRGSSRWSQRPTVPLYRYVLLGGGGDQGWTYGCGQPISGERRSRVRADSGQSSVLRGRPLMSSCSTL